MNSSQIKFQRIFEQGRYSDLLQLSDGRILTGDGSSFDIHKVILARCSDFFRSLFCGMDKGKREYKIININGECMSDILCYIYTKNICLTEMNIKDLLVASDYFLLNDLYLKVKECIKSTITDTNCLQLYHAAYQLNENEILQHCFLFIQAKFEQIVQNQKYGLTDLPLELLKRILSNRNLNVRNERTVWEAINHWTQAFIQYRLKDVPSLLSTLALKDVGETLASDIINHDIVLNNINTRTLRNIESFKDFNSSRDILVKILLNFSNNSPLKNFRIPRKLNVISRCIRKYGEDGPGEIFISYDETLDLWRKITEIDFEPEYLIPIGSNIYVFQKLGRRCMNFNLRSMKWKPMQNVNFYNHTVLAIENCIFVLGLNGYGTYYIELYDVAKNTWLRLASLDDTCSASAVAIGKNLFIVGVAPSLDMIAQMFNPLTQRLNFLSSPRIFRSHFELINYHGKIYLIGGVNAFNEAVLNVEVYDPAINRWKQLPDLPFIYSWVAVIVLNDQMIVFDFIPRLAKDEPGTTAVGWNETQECWENLKLFHLPRKLDQYRLCTVCDVETVKILTKENRNSRMEKSPFNYF